MSYKRKPDMFPWVLVGVMLMSHVAVIVLYAGVLEKNDALRPLEGVLDMCIEHNKYLADELSERRL